MDWSTRTSQGGKCTVMSCALRPYPALRALQVPPHIRRQQLARDGVHSEVGLQALRGEGVVAQEGLRALPGTGRADLPAGAVHSRLYASAAISAAAPSGPQQHNQTCNKCSALSTDCQRPCPVKPSRSEVQALHIQELHGECLSTAEAGRCAKHAAALKEAASAKRSPSSEPCMAFSISTIIM